MEDLIKPVYLISSPQAAECSELIYLDLARIFLRFLFKRLIRFFFHFSLMLTDVAVKGSKESNMAEFISASPGGVSSRRRYFAKIKNFVEECEIFYSVP